MGITISGATGIDMGDKPISNVSQVDSTVINENGDNVTTISDLNTAGIALKTIATGTATFTATTNNINLTGIGIGVEVGDVIQISGAIDAKNNSEFTVEVITDANNIIVNQAHANKGTTKNVAAQVGNVGVTVKLLSKWYNATIGLGQDWVDTKSIRSLGTTYINYTKRAIGVSISITLQANTSNDILVNDVSSWFLNSPNTAIIQTGCSIVSSNATYRTNTTTGTLTNWKELR